LNANLQCNDKEDAVSVDGLQQFFPSHTLFDPLFLIDAVHDLGESAG
jgi:hypothetical protein